VGPSIAAAALAGIAAAFVFLPGGGGPAGATSDRIVSEPPAVTLPSTRPDVTDNSMTASLHHTSATLQTRVQVQKSAAARRRAIAAKKAKQAPPAPVSTPSAPPTSAPPSSPPSSPPPSSGTDAAHSALGNCIRNAEQGGSYAWGPGNGGGAYQFLESTWEAYGGAVSEFGVAGPAYQDQIFDNAIAAGGASNWTNYDGC
jgi:Transglycosylase-like domain